MFKNLQVVLAEDGHGPKRETVDKSIVTMIAATKGLSNEDFGTLLGQGVPRGAKAGRMTDAIGEVALREENGLVHLMGASKVGEKVSPFHLVVKGDRVRVAGADGADLDKKDPLVAVAKKFSKAAPSAEDIELAGSLMAKAKTQAELHPPAVETKVNVTRQELQAFLGGKPEGEGRYPFEPKVVEALKALGPAITQPIYEDRDGKPAKSGRTADGVEGAKLLLEGFGNSNMRGVVLNNERLAGMPGAAAALESVRETSDARQRDSQQLRGQNAVATRKKNAEAAKEGAER